MPVSGVGTQTTNPTTTQTTDSGITNAFTAQSGMYMQLFLEGLKNQDPFNTQDTGQMMQQMSQLGFMEQVESMKKAVEGLTKISENQALTNSSSILGKLIVATDSEGNPVKGKATAMRIKDGVVEYLVGSKVVSMGQIMEIGEVPVDSTKPPTETKPPEGSNGGNTGESNGSNESNGSTDSTTQTQS